MTNVVEGAGVIGGGLSDRGGLSDSGGLSNGGELSDNSRLSDDSGLRHHPGIRQAARILQGLVIGLVILLVVWQVMTAITHLPALVFKSPIDVYRWLVEGRQANANRISVLDPLGTTLRDALLGWIVGAVLAVTVSCLFSLSKLVEGVVLPVAFLLQSVPILALTPLISVEFGRGLTSVVVITTVITFLPTLLTVTLGLRSCPPTSGDLIHVYGGGRLFHLWHVALPSALPSIFAAVRLSAPTSLVAALLAEYFSTGTGIGNLLAASQTSYDYTQIWAAVALIGVCGLLLYALVSLIEVPVLVRFDAEAFEV
jgi:ABC-type nitrate/sulfonate/bicarbonate transport system permease component